MNINIHDQVIDDLNERTDISHGDLTIIVCAFVREIEVGEILSEMIGKINTESHREVASNKICNEIMSRYGL